MSLNHVEELCELLLENVEEYALIAINLDGRIETWSVGAERIFGYSEAEAAGLPIELIFTDEDRRSDVPQWEMERARNTGKADDERWHRRKDGSLFWARGVLRALYDDGGTLRGYGKVLRDNTERKAWEEELRRLNESLEERVRHRTRQVRKLALSLARAERVERRRIAQLLHEDTQQLLFGVRMQLEILRDEAGTAERDVIRDRAENIRKWIERALRMTRRLTADLNPPLLHEAGFVEAMIWLRKQMKELFGFTLTVVDHGWVMVPDEDLRELLFRAVRELVFNVVKHAHTSHATVELGNELHAVDGPYAIVRVRDFGTGFGVDPTELALPDDGGAGLLRLRERIRLVGGHLDVISQPNEGTLVTIRMPVNPPDPSERKGVG